MYRTRLKELREEKDMTITMLAQVLNVSTSIISRWESDKDVIPTRRLYQLANYYKVNTDYILKLTDVKKNIKSPNEIDLKIVSQRVRELRDDVGLSLRQIAKKLNTSNSTWNAYETGKVLILCSFLIYVCKTYNYSSDWILGRSSNKHLSNQ